MKPTKETIHSAAIDTLKSIFDPEIPVNIYDLGFIYNIDVSDDLAVKVLMTLSAPNCPVAESLPAEVRQRILGIDGVSDAQVEITFDPPWSMDKMSDAAKLELDLFL
ncbi:MAG: DUF59 domain-containing protein [Bacteroidales bacterium]|nr:DUF59 domain-containing protein [Bacteroidales bacterium]